MKKSGIIIAILVTYSMAFCQTYSNIINDSIIINFMNDVLVTKESYKSAFNKLPKNVFFKPIDNKKAPWKMTYDQDTFTFYEAFDKLIRDYKITKESIEFLKEQYNNTQETIWQHPLDRVRFKKKFKKDYFKYTVPLFFDNYQKAIFWRYTYCGSLCAYSELHIYKIVDGKWVIDSFVDGWIS